MTPFTSSIQADTLPLPLLAALLLIPIISIVMMVAALRLALKRSQGKELVLWIVGFLLIPIICPATALFYFRDKPEL